MMNFEMLLLYAKAHLEVSLDKFETLEKQKPNIPTVKSILPALQNDLECINHLIDQLEQYKPLVDQFNNQIGFMACKDDGERAIFNSLQFMKQIMPVEFENLKKSFEEKQHD